MDKDPRYEASLVMWQNGKITVFSELFKWMPFTVVARNMGIAQRRLRKCIADPSLLTSEDIYRLSNLYMLRPAVIKDLIRAQLKAVPRAKHQGRPPAGG